MAFLLAGLFLLFFHLLVVELATSFLGTNIVLEEVVAVLSVKGDCGVSLELFIEALL